MDQSETRNKLELLKINLKLELESGLCIGGSSNNFDIGAIDTEVIKNPLTNVPYIPGSSLKGKLRYLLNVNNESNDLIDKLFGVANGEKNKNDDIGISRLIFRDLELSEGSKKEIENILGKGCYTEIKAENALNNGIANPRFIERVPKGAKFKGEIIVQVFDGDNKKEFLGMLRNAIGYLNDNYLGGSGTRGYGKVKITSPDLEQSKDN